MAQRAGYTSLPKCWFPPNAMEIVGTGPAEAEEEDASFELQDLRRVLQCDEIYSGSMGCGVFPC
jgi:hypothetical protein